MKVAVSRAGRRAGLESAFILAVFVGHHGRSGALMALTEHGAVNARSFKRLPESDRFVASELEKLKGLFWNLNGSLEAERLDRPLIDALGIPILPILAGVPPLPPEMQERRMYVTSADVRKYGGSEVVRRVHRRVHKCTHGVGPTCHIRTLAREGFRNL